MASPPPASGEAFLDVAGARLRYRDEGAGFSVLLLHGWALDLEMWRMQVERWSTRFRVVRFDRRGFGASSGTPSVPDDGRDVAAIADHLRIARFALVGMSQGGRAALNAAAGALAARIACLVLDGAPFEEPGSPAGNELPLDEYRDVARREGLDAFRRLWSAHPLARLHTADPEAHELLRAMTRRYRAADLLTPIGPQGATTAQAPALDAIRVPVLVVNGALDTERRRAMGEALARALPRAERMLIPGAGHLAALDNPRAYDEVVGRFLARYAASN